jgi:hypothetical protein
MSLTKRKTCKKQKTIRIHKRKQVKKQRRHKTKKGGLYKGGSSFGPPSFNGGVPISAFYPYNSNQGGSTDPINPSNIVDARLSGNGLSSNSGGNPLSTQIW